MQKKAPFSTYIVALALFLAGIGYLAWSGFTVGRIPFVNVAEVLRAPAGAMDRAKLFGSVSGQGLNIRPDGLGAHFLLVDKDNADLKLWVDYRGALPDTFQEGAEVIVEGSLRPAAFNAISLITKCPSKYEKANRRDNT
ncbi:MAG: cytochrome c maturation protein CcmE [Desulfovibrio sp.]|jgi:cytochrome c-type biogenesis protein CcmE|nr:cytochrome c maturation protein CcmE [Desulfovibrio sp.]